MEEYFITRYKSIHIPCHEDEPKCSKFKPGGCAWLPRKKNGINRFCSQANLSTTATIRNNSVSYPMGASQELPEDCPFILHCGGLFRFCDNASLSPQAAKSGYSCEKNIVQVPLYRFFIDKFNEAEKDAFLLFSMIEGDTDFRLASESELLTDLKNQTLHDKLLYKYSCFVRQKQVRPVIEKSPDDALIKRYEQAAKEAKKHVMSNALAEMRKDPAIKSTALPLSPEDQLRKDVQGFPPLPTDGKSNDDWMTLSDFVKLFDPDDKTRGINTMRGYFAPSKKPVKITVGQNVFGRCGQGRMNGVVWGQVPTEMKADKNDSGYFILRKSIPAHDVLCPPKKKKDKK